jgi:hypothetical protein
MTEPRLQRISQDPQFGGQAPHTSLDGFCVVEVNVSTLEEVSDAKA